VSPLRGIGIREPLYRSAEDLRRTPAGGVVVGVSDPSSNAIRMRERPEAFVGSCSITASNHGWHPAQEMLSPLNIGQWRYMIGGEGRGLGNRTKGHVTTAANPRLRRLQADYDSVRAEFSGHPHVTVAPVGDRLPPERYHVQFRLRGLVLDGDQPGYRDVHEVDITLPRGYPSEKPYCVPLQPIFHPNIKDYFCIADYWAAGTSLVDVISKLGEMIQWRVYNPRSPLDAIAARWAVAQEQSGMDIFPVGKVDLGVADFAIELRARGATMTLAPLSDPTSDAEADFVVALRS
jgi:ubiquitin-protein ligase